MHCTTTGAHKDTRHRKPCCKVVSAVHILTGPQLLCSRFGAMWDGNQREATKLWTCDTDWSKIRLPLRSTVHQIDQKKGCMVSPKSVHQRHLGCLCVLTVGGEPLHATCCALRPTQMDPRRDVHWIHQEECPNSLVSGTVLCGIAIPISTLSLPQNCTSLSLGHSAMMSSQLLYVTH